MASRMLVVWSLFFLSGPAFSATPCSLGTAEGEKLLREARFAEARRSLEETVARCRAVKAEKSGRPFLALGKAYMELNRPREALPLFEDAIRREPNLAVGYVNLGAAHLALKEPHQAIAALEKALSSTEARVQMLANHNLGLAYFSIAAAKDDRTDTRAAPYFMRSRELDRSFGGNYFYLGVLAERMSKDLSGAEALYKQGCERHYEAACRALRVREKATAPSAAPPRS